MARYHYKNAYQPTKYDDRETIGWKLQKLETIIQDSETGEILGRDTQFVRYLGSADAIWAGLLGNEMTFCKGSAPNSPDLRYLLYHYVLIPAKH